jgi:hypothetical protein
MTHTLHRRGSPEDLQGDWVVLAMAARRSGPKDAAAGLRSFLSLALDHGPVNWGDMGQNGRFRSDLETLLAGITDHSLVHAVFTDPEAVTGLLADLKEADLGLSVVVSGLLEGVAAACRRAGLDPGRSTVQLSLGSWGATERLPEGEALEAVSMCGHGLVSAALVESTAAAVAEGRLSSEAGARRLAEPCTCGIFNPERAAMLLEALAARRELA